MEATDLLAEIEKIRTSDLPGNIRASKIYSLKCQLRKLGWSDDAPTDGQHITWICPICKTRLITHIPMTEVSCARHSPRPRMQAT
jgi:hypothetical protein